jgi:hypothetical protein
MIGSAVRIRVMKSKPNKEITLAEWNYMVRERLKKKPEGNNACEN